ncbi:MAG: exo-alpha-sialidase [Gemmatimonadetes bacterium]|nr:exo-alpha-sialidase [Gemmatimonadota bacterium]
MCAGLLLAIASRTGAAGAQQFTPEDAGRDMAAQRSIQARDYGDKARAAARDLAQLRTREFVPSEIECRVRSGAATDVNLDCDHPFLPNNEPHVAVNPNDPQHVVASSNDFDSCCDEFYTTFDAGRTWTTGNMSSEDPGRIGSDPVTTFDPQTGRVIHASLNFKITNGLADDGDLVVSLSDDGGITWGNPVVVSDGIGDDFAPVQYFNDKPWIVTDYHPSSPHYGRTYMTWSRFFSRNGFYVESPIFESHSDDAGRNWSRPQEISGTSAALCTFQVAGEAGRCDQDQYSIPTVGPDGTVYVAFLNSQHEAAWEEGEFGENQYLVVRSTDGGEAWSDPVHVVDLEDGSRDYPFNVDGRRTLTGYQVRVNAAGNIDADPTSGKIYLTFADNRAGRRDVNQPVTDVNVYLMTSLDGATWSGPTVVSDEASDQWFPWLDVNPVNGSIGVLFHDRSTPLSPALYDNTLATGLPGSFRFETLSTQSSHPRASLFFQAGAPGCQRCATFFGDYNSLDYGPDGAANAAWTDMRRFLDLGEISGYTENIFFRRLP